MVRCEIALTEPKLKLQCGVNLDHHALGATGLGEMAGLGEMRGLNLNVYLCYCITMSERAYSHRSK